jgi:uncharacterized RDD family membrane protein YckC
MEPDNNPYSPPQAEPLQQAYDAFTPSLASPWTRLGAQIIDGLIVMVVTLPAMYITGYFTRAVANQTSEGGMFGMIGEQLVWAVAGIALYLAINWKFLQNGQTIGKKLTSIRIVRKDGSPIDAMRIITHRILPVQLAAQVPCVGSLAVLVDALLIFRSERNTLHDDIADTKVVVVPPQTI